MDCRKKMGQYTKTVLVEAQMFVPPLKIDISDDIIALNFSQSLLISTVSFFVMKISPDKVRRCFCRRCDKEFLVL